MSQPGLAFSLLLAAAVGVLAWRVGWLSPSGAWAAALVGGACLAGGGWGSAGLLLAFFVSSNLLARVGSTRRRSMEGVVAKGERRDAWQVLANGGVPALLAIAVGLGARQGLWLAAMTGAWAAATADTWGTEWGAFSRQLPRLITGGGPVAPGTSGGVTWLGGLGSAAGGLVIGALAAWWWHDPLLVVAGGLAGVVGSAFDSWLGAKAQAIYYCPRCASLTEQHPLHGCGSPTAHRRGLTWMGNDLVNLLAILAGAAVGLGLAGAWG